MQQTNGTGTRLTEEQVVKLEVALQPLFQQFKVLEEQAKLVLRGFGAAAGIPNLAIGIDFNLGKISQGAPPAEGPRAPLAQGDPTRSV